MLGMIQCPDTLRCCCYRLRFGTFTPIVTGALFLFLFRTTLSVIDFRTQLLPDKLTLPLLWRLWYLMRSLD